MDIDKLSRLGTKIPKGFFEKEEPQNTQQVEYTNLLSPAEYSGLHSYQDLYNNYRTLRFNNYPIIRPTCFNYITMGPSHISNTSRHEYDEKVIYNNEREVYIIIVKKFLEDGNEIAITKEVSLKMTLKEWKILINEIINDMKYELDKMERENINGRI